MKQKNRVSFHRVRTAIVRSVLSLPLVGSVLLLASSSTNPVPFLNQPLLPAAVTPGGSGFTLTVNGTGFVSGSVVNWNGTARATTFVSSSQLTASILASDIATPDTSSVTVVNPTPGGGTSNVAFFDVAPSTPVTGFILSSVDAGSQSSSVAIGDFNRDGKLDVAAANPANNTVSVFLGNGDGTFQSAVNYATGLSPAAIAVGDFNEDGKLDLAVANSGGSDISVLLGNGDGTFQTAVSYATGSSPAGIAVGDFNQDGKLDLAVANSGESDISVLLGNGDGTFRAPVNYVTGSGGGPGSTRSAPDAIAVGDFNQDGKLDLAVANYGCVSVCGNISVLLGNGDGTFQSPANYVVGAQPTSVAAADLNADGKLDLVVANGSTFNVSVLLGNGDGTFQATVNYSAPCCGDPAFVAVGDLNGDGKPDLVVGGDVSCGGFGCGGQGGGVGVLLGNGDGTFRRSVRYVTAQIPEAVAIGDFNGDGRLDVAVATAWRANDAFDLLLNAGNSSFTLSLTQAGNGMGTVMSDSPGINCTTSCSGSFPGDSIVTLTGTPATGSFFLGWSGPCTGVSPCSLDMNADQAVTTTFGTSPISVSISPSTANVTAGSSVVFTATVNNDPNNLGVSWRLPSCRFPAICVGGTLSGTSPTSATYTAPANAAGKQTTITVTSNQDPSKATHSTINIMGVSDFLLSPASASLTAQRGGQVTDVITIAPQNGSFGSAVQLSCAVTGSTPTATCSLSPTSVTPGANPATSTLTITAPGLSAQLPLGSHHQFLGTLYAVFLPLIRLGVIDFSLEFGKAKHRRHQLWLSYGLFIAFVALQVGCGGGSTGQQTQPLNYNVSVTATSGAIQHTTQITVIVP